MPAYKSKLTAALKAEFPFLKQSESEEHSVQCTVCNSKFSVAHGGRYDITQHLRSVRHQNSKKNASSSNKLDSYLVDLKTSTPDELKISSKELTFAYHSAKHSLSLRAADCTSKLITKLLEPKFTSGKTKTSMLIQKVSFFNVCIFF